MESAKKEFDPLVSFMFFGTWLDAIEAIERADTLTAYKFFKAIANYSMYGEEPDFSDNPLVNATWLTVEREIDLSVRNRKRGFAKDTFNEKYQTIKDTLISNPSASIREIADMTGTDKNMVHRVKKKFGAEIEATIAAMNRNPNNSVSKDSIGDRVKDIACNLDYDSDNNAVSVVDTDSVNVIDSVNDSTGRDKAGQVGQAQECEIDPLTCCFSDWTNLPEDIKKRFTVFDRMRARFSNCIEIDNNSEDAVRVRNKWNNLYSKWLQSITTEDVRAILKRYLSEHEESPLLKKIGDKYGRIIDGWNAEAEAPNIVYSHTYFTKWRKHNLAGIPVEYYRSEVEELSIEEEREALREYYAEIGVDMSAYEEDADGEMPF